jgi:outer membrane beta-barrel protein
MASRVLVFLLKATLAGVLPLVVAQPLAAAEDEAGTVEESEGVVQERVIEPDIQRREISRKRIDTEDFEVGVYGGMMSVEDFGVNAVFGARFAYHISAPFMLEATYGQTDTGETSYEVLSGGAQLLDDDERTLRYYALSFGWNVLPGEAFVGRKRAYNTALYLMAGAGSTTFAGDDQFTANFGLAWSVLPNDWLAVHADMRDHLFDSDLLGEKKTVHNFEAHVGLTIFF